LTTRPPVTSRQGMMRLASMGAFLRGDAGYRVGWGCDLTRRRGDAEKDAENALAKSKTASAEISGLRDRVRTGVEIVAGARKLCATCRSGWSCELQEVADDFQADGAGFLRVELDSVDVAAFERGGVAELIGAGGAGTRVLGHVVAVREVHVGARVEIADELRAGAHFQLVPAHVGNAGIDREALYGAGVDAEAADFGGLLAGFEQRLHAETDAEDGHAGLNAVDQRLAHAQGIQGTH